MRRISTRELPAVHPIALPPGLNAQTAAAVRKARVLYDGLSDALARSAIPLQRREIIQARLDHTVLSLRDGIERGDLSDWMRQVYASAARISAVTGRQIDVAPQVVDVRRSLAPPGDILVGVVALASFAWGVFHRSASA